MLNQILHVDELVKAHGLNGSQGVSSANTQLELLDKRALAGLNRIKRDTGNKRLAIAKGLVSKVLYQHWFIANANHYSEELLRLPDYE